MTGTIRIFVAHLREPITFQSSDLEKDVAEWLTALKFPRGEATSCVSLGTSTGGAIIRMDSIQAIDYEETHHD